MPIDGFNGTDTLSLSLTDTDANGTESASASYTLNVQAINRAPVITLPTDQALDEDSSITFSTANSNALSISDDATENPGTESIEVTLTALASSGVLTLGSTAGLAFTAGMVHKTPPSASPARWLMPIRPWRAWSSALWP